MRSRTLPYLFGIAALCSTSLPAKAEITRQDTREIFAAIHAAYDAELGARGESIHLNSAPSGVDWLDYPHIHASYSRYSTRNASGRSTLHHEISIFGGMIELPGMTRDSAALILCHELGHGLGGAPFKDASADSEKMSVEGQADFYAASVCLPRVFRYLAQPLTPLWAPSPRAIAPDPARLVLERGCPDEICRRSFAAAEGFRALLSRVWGPRGETRWDLRDASAVSAVDTRPAHYPSAQCRLDTLVNGILKSERPACWFSVTLSAPDAR